jgi:hypothetical protein
MKTILPYAAFAAALALAGPGLAQSTAGQSTASQPMPPTAAPDSTMPSSKGAPPSSMPSSGATAPTGADASANAGATADVAAGMSVKDNTGTTIGSVTDVKNDLATIKMGSDTFTVETSKLAVQNGAATINATQAELKKMMPPKK